MSFRVGRRDVRRTRLISIELLGYKVRNLTFRRDSRTRVVVGLKKWESVAMAVVSALPFSISKPESQALEPPPFVWWRATHHI